MAVIGRKAGMLGALERQVKEADEQRLMQFKPYYEYDMTPPEYVIDGILPADSIINGYGDPATCKSLYYHEALFCISAGIPFFGHEVKQGTVLMFVGEGLQGVLRRLRALEIKLGIQTPPFHITPVSAMLSDPGSCDEIIEAIQEIPGPIRAIGIDTLARNFGSGNENSTQDMNVAVHNLDEIRRYSGGAAIITIHHLGKMDKSTGRGSSVLRGAADMEYLFTKDKDDIVRVECTKVKDGESPEPQAFRIGTVDIDMLDRYGRKVYPPTLYSIDYTPEKGSVRVGATEAAFLTIIKGLSKDGDILEIEARKNLLDVGYSKQQVGSTLKRMQNKGFISRNDGKIRISQ